MTETQHTQWLEDPDVAVSHTWNRDRYPEWVTTAQLLRRLCEDFMARFVYHTSYMVCRPNQARTILLTVDIVRKGRCVVLVGRS